LRNSDANHTGKLIAIRKSDGSPDAFASFDYYSDLFQKGDEAGLKIFFLEFHAPLALFANRWVNNRSVAEEIASEAFVRVWKFHYKLNNYFKIRAYLYKTVLRISQRVIEQEKKRTKLHPVNESQVDPGLSPFDQMVRSETCRMIHKCLKDLPNGSRRVLTMHYLEGKTTGEIASELNLSPSTIKTQKAQGLAALRKKITPPSIILFLLSVQLFFASL
jgi:RNA polymerase sigma-70 factor (ECF subfamily)